MPKELQAPARVEPGPKGVYEESSSTRSARRTREERSGEYRSGESRSAERRREARSDSGPTTETRTAALRRPRAELQVESSSGTSALGVESSPEPAIETSMDSPVPVAESEPAHTGDLQVEDSPIPQPEN